MGMKAKTPFALMSKMGCASISTPFPLPLPLPFALCPLPLPSVGSTDQRGEGAFPDNDKRRFDHQARTDEKSIVRFDTNQWMVFFPA